jgi:exodeoxyribonuclease V beta subunit
MVLLAQWRELAAQRRFETLFHRMMEDSQFAPRTLALGGGERAIVNTQHLFELLSEYASTQRMEFIEIVQLLHGWMAGNEVTRLDDADLQRMESDGDAVQIITVHRAKGLEAAVVFWYGGDAGLPPRPVQMYVQDGQRKIAIGLKQPKEVHVKVREQQDQENRRVAYVGVTRSKLRLYLPKLPKEAKFPNTASYGPVHERLQQLQSRVGDPTLLSLFRFDTIDLDAGNAIGVDVGQDDEIENEDEGASATVSAAAVSRLVSFVPESSKPLADALMVPNTLSPGQTLIDLWSYSRLARRQKTIQPPDEGGKMSDSFGENVDVALQFDEVIDDAIADVTPANTQEQRGLHTSVEGQLPGGASAGLFVHALLEHIPLDDWKWASVESFVQDSDMQALAKRCAAPNGIVDELHIAHGMTLAYHCLALPHQASTGMRLPPLRQARMLAREVPFMYAIDGYSNRWFDEGRLAPGFMRGAMDAVVCWGSPLDDQGDGANPGDAVWIIDYKSDTLIHGGASTTAAAHAKVASAYQLQADVYTEAARRFCGDRLAGVLLYFVRYQVVIAVPYENGILLPAVAHAHVGIGGPS